MREKATATHNAGQPGSNSFVTSLTVTITPDSSSTLTDNTELTANVTGTAESYTYEWYRGTTKIDGATSSTYTTTAADIGNAIKVVATQASPASTGESAATATVTARTHPENETTFATPNPDKGGNSPSGSISPATPQTGATVTYTANPLPGWVAQSVTITKTGDTTTTVAATQDGSNPNVFTFTMLEYPVTITPTFEKIAYTVAAPSAVDNGNVTVSEISKADNDSKASGTTTASVGDTVKLTVTPATGYHLGTLTVTYNDGTSDQTITPSENGNNYEFTMPAANIASIAATFSNYKALDDTTKPTITLTNSHTAPIIDDVLTASTTANPVTWQWYVGGTAVTGETNATYTVKAADYNKTIYVVATQSTGEGGAALNPALTQQSDATSEAVKIDGPDAPATVSAIATTNTITVTPAQDGTKYEYSIDDGTNWTTDNPITGLIPGMSYTVQVREKETATHKAGTAGSATVATLPETPDAPTITDTTDNSITVNPTVAGNVYLVLPSGQDPTDAQWTGANAQTATDTNGLTFTKDATGANIDGTSSYKVWTRVPANGNIPASAPNSSNVESKPANDDLGNVTGTGSTTGNGTDGIITISPTNPTLQYTVAPKGEKPTWNENAKNGKDDNSALDFYNDCNGNKIKAATAYQIWARKISPSVGISIEINIIIVIPPAPGELPTTGDEGETTVTATSITVKPVTSGYEYIIVKKTDPATTPTEDHWTANGKKAADGDVTTGLSFDKDAGGSALDPNTEYEILVRVPARSGNPASDPARVTAKTNRSELPNREDLAVKLTSYVVGSTPGAASLSPALPAGAGSVKYYYSSEPFSDTVMGTEWKNDDKPTLAAGNYYIRAVISAGDVYEGHTTPATLFRVTAEPTYDIRATAITTHESDMLLTLKQGNDIIAQELVEKKDFTGSNPYSAVVTFPGVAGGTYNVVAKQTVDGNTVTMTALVVLEKNEEVDITMPTGFTNSELVLEEDVPVPVVVGGLDDEAAANDEGNKTVNVDMSITNAESDAESPAGATQEEKAKAEQTKKEIDAIKEMAGTSASANMVFLNVSITKTVLNKGVAESYTAITQTKNVIEMVVPYDLPAGSFFNLFRYHGDSASRITRLNAMPAMTNGAYAASNDGKYFYDAALKLLHIFGNGFSIYAISVTGTDPETYSITVERGTAAPTSAAAGATVTITANAAPSGQTFNRWTTADGVSFANAASATTTFTMPAKDVTVTATYRSAGGGGGGGGGSYTPTYPVKIEETEHGTVTASPMNPERNDIVTIRPVPEDGYAVDTVTATDTSGKNVDVTDNKDGTYSFRQPGSIVKVQVTYQPIESGEPVAPVGFANCPKDETCPISGFTDADPKMWYHDGVHWALDNAFMSGIGHGLFAPNTATSRAMIVTILWRMEGEPTVNYAMTFEDVPSEQWYTEAIRWATSTGIVTGYSDTAFGPNDNVSREQLAAILYRYAQSKGEGFKGEWMFLLDYPDAADVSDWADEAMHWMVMNQIINGMGDGTLNPKEDATRAQVATMLMRYHNFIG